jgi:adenylate kinase family enzyme
MPTDAVGDTQRAASIMRIAIFGAPGSGKSHLAARLGSALSLPATHLDDLFWLSGWRECETGRFRDQVADVVSADAWVVDGNYSRVRDLVLGRATWTVAIDLPFWANVWRVTARSVGRRFGWEHVTPLPCQVQADGEPLLEALRAFPPVIWRYKRGKLDVILDEIHAAEIPEGRRVVIQRQDDIECLVRTLSDATTTGLDRAGQSWTDDPASET